MPTGRVYGAARGERRSAARLRGRGLSVYLEWTGALPTETVDIEVDGKVGSRCSRARRRWDRARDLLHAALTEVLVLAPEKVRIVQGDTDRANGVGSVGSRSAFVGGPPWSPRQASDQRGKRARGRGAGGGTGGHRVSRWALSHRRHDRAITLGELAGRQERKVFRVSATETPSTPSWPNGAQVCEVEIDRETGEVQVASVASCDDIGRIINHTIVEGRSTAAWRRAPARRCRSRRSTTRKAAAVDRIADGLQRAARHRPAADARQLRRRACLQDEPAGVKGCGELGTIGAMPAWSTRCSTRSASCTWTCRSPPRGLGGAAIAT